MRYKTFSAMSTHIGFGAAFKLLGKSRRTTRQRQLIFVVSIVVSNSKTRIYVVTNYVSID
jgi:hypothetical protein